MIIWTMAYSFSSTKGSLMNVASTTLPITPTLPGFNFVLGNQLSPQVVLNALHQYTDVKILSNPSLVVTNNQPATLEVGDQVPVSTGSATVLSANNAVVNTVDYKNTGIILHVQPRVNANGTVLLDIEQEISAVVNNLTAGRPRHRHHQPDADDFGAQGEERIVGRRTARRCCWPA